MAKYKYAYQFNTAVNDLEKGLFGIKPGTPFWEGVEQWLAQGNNIEPFETPEETSARIARQQQQERYAADAEIVKAYPKLQAIANMTPSQVGDWVEANINTLAAAKDAIKTLAMAVCVLARRL